MKHIRNILPILFIFFAALSARSQINTDQVMRIGQNALYFEDYVLSIQYFNRVIQAKPWLPEPYLMRAIAKLNLDDYRGAEADATKAIELNPFITDAYEVRGVARQNRNNPEAAIEDYSKALEMLPENRQILFNKALAEHDIKDYAAATATFERLIKAHPGFDNAYIGRAQLLLDSGDTIAARSDLDHALEINRNATNAYVLRANIAIAAGGDLDSALVDMDEAIRLQPRLAGLYINRAFLRYKLDNFFGAMADYDYAIELEPLNQVALYNRALLRAEIRDVNKAIDDLDRVLRLEPDNYPALYNRAVLLSDIHEYKRATDDLDRVIEAYPDFAGAYSLRSHIKREAGNMREAEADHNRSLALMRKPVKKADTGTDSAQASASGSHDSHEEEPETQEQVAARFSTLLTISDNAEIEQEFNNRSIRGKVQDRNINIEAEPMFTLSFYTSVDKDINPSGNAHYIKEVDELNSSRILRFLIMVTNHEPQLTDEEIIQRHFQSIEYYNSLIATSEKPRAIDYFGRAMDLMITRNYQAAIADLTRAVDMNPDFALGYFLRSVARYRLVEADRGTTSSASAAAIAAEETRLQMTEVMKDLDKAIEHSPRFAIAYYNKGVIYAEQGDYTSALSAFNHAIELKPDMGEAYYNRGYSYFRLGNREAGSADLSKAGELGILPSYNLLKRMTTH